jgi:hypothetical protein
MGGAIRAIYSRFNQEILRQDNDALDALSAATIQVLASLLCSFLSNEMI